MADARGDLALFVKAHGTKTTARDFGKLDKAQQGVIGSAKRLIGVYIGLKGLQMVGEMSKQAAVAKDVAVSFERLAVTQGVTLQSLRDGVKGTVDDLTLMQKANTAALLGLPLERFDEMLGIARSASKATGESMEFMLNSIVTALGRGSKLMLDNLGIMINVEQANEDYARSIGKVARQLSDAERKQAFINTALDIGNANVARTGKTTDSYADINERAATNTKNLALAIGKELTPAVSGLKGIWIDITQELIDYLDTTDRLIKSAKDLPEGLTPFETLVGKSDTAKKSTDTLILWNAEAQKSKDLATGATDIFGAMFGEDPERFTGLAEIGRGLSTGIDLASLSLFNMSEAEKEAILNARILQAQMAKTKDEAARMDAVISSAFIQHESPWAAAGAVIRSELAMATAAYLRTVLVGVPWPLNLALGAAAGAVVGGLFNAAVPSFAQGGDFVTNGPQLIQVGDNASGRERVRVDPLGPTGGGGEAVENHFHFHGVPPTDDYLRDTFMPAFNRVNA